jgi:hypothetical protein
MMILLTAFSNIDISRHYPSRRNDGCAKCLLDIDFFPFAFECMNFLLVRILGFFNYDFPIFSLELGSSFAVLAPDFSLPFT